MDLDRRQLICGLGGAVCGAACASVIPSVAQAADTPQGEFKRFVQMGGDFSWKPHKLDVKEVQKLAYEAYYNKGYACGFGVFYALIGLHAEKFGAPYNQFPFSMMEVFKGGISDWGSICGALGGSASAFALFWGRKERNAMVDELYHWYETTALPIYDPGEAAVLKEPIKANVSESIICHISVSKWCYASKKGETSKARSERCGRLTADVAGKACEIFNDKIDKGKDWKGTYVAAGAVKQCGECHKTKDSGSDWAKGHMNCTPCHDGRKAVGNHFVNHP